MAINAIKERESNEAVWTRDIERSVMALGDDELSSDDVAYKVRCVGIHRMIISNAFTVEPYPTLPVTIPDGWAVIAVTKDYMGGTELIYTHPEFNEKQLYGVLHPMMISRFGIDPVTERLKSYDESLQHARAAGFETVNEYRWHVYSAEERERKTILNQPKSLWTRFVDWLWG